MERKRVYPTDKFDADLDPHDPAAPVVPHKADEIDEEARRAEQAREVERLKRAKTVAPEPPEHDGNHALEGERLLAHIPQGTLSEAVVNGTVEALAKLQLEGFRIDGSPISVKSVLDGTRGSSGHHNSATADPQVRRARSLIARYIAAYLVTECGVRPYASSLPQKVERVNELFVLAARSRQAQEDLTPCVARLVARKRAQIAALSGGRNTAA